MNLYIYIYIHNIYNGEICRSYRLDNKRERRYGVIVAVSASTDTVTVSRRYVKPCLQEREITCFLPGCRVNIYVSEQRMDRFCYRDRCLRV